tara:strand:+ start:469 stop:849 length:381 start_codon:yes stop_codon:yes gene_type:complete
MIEKRLDQYVEMIQEKVDKCDHGLLGYHKLGKKRVKAEIRKKYARVMLCNAGQSCVHSFVNMENGDILKGGATGPVKNGVRGNIFADDLGADRVGQHGPYRLDSHSKVQNLHISLSPDQLQSLKIS